MMGHASLVKITEEELWEIENDFDPIEAPPGPFKIQPENQGLDLPDPSTRKSSQLSLVEVK